LKGGDDLNHTVGLRSTMHPIHPAHAPALTRACSGAPPPWADSMKRGTQRRRLFHTSV